MKNRLKLLQFGLIFFSMVCALNSEGAEYAGWTVGMLWSSTQATILRSTDSGVSWTLQGSGQVAAMPMFGVHAVDANTAWVVGQSDSMGATIYHTTDGGQSWTRMLSATQVPNISVLQKVTTFGDSSIWAVGPGAILHSADSGVTWTNQLPIEYANAPFQGVSTPDGVNVWATGSTLDNLDALILKSSDGGAHWTRQNGPDVQRLVHILDVYSLNANTAFAIGSNGSPLAWTVIQTNDGGNTWTGTNQGGPGDGNAIYAVNESMIWGVTDNNTIWSNNGGVSWSSTGSEFFTMGISAIDSQMAWAVSSSDTGPTGAIQRTTDGGMTWIKQIQVSGTNIPALFTVSFAQNPLPPTVSVSASTPDAYEFGPVPGIFTISQTGSSALSIHYTVGGTAINGYRYSISGTSISISGSSIQLNVPPIPNNIYDGDQTVILTLTSGSGYVIGSGSTATVTIHDKPINSWQFVQFGAQANNAVVSGNLVSNNSAGIPNLMTYALGIGATTATVSRLPIVGQSANHLTLSFAQNPAAIDITYTVQGSSDLSSWSTISTFCGGSWSPSNNVTETSGTAILQDTIPMNSGTKRFLRLEITH